jgi:LemA protein
MTWIILGIILIVVVFAIAIYNKLVGMRNTVRSAWSDIDVQLKKRFDLVPSLVDTVKAYAKHEQGVFEKVTAARTQAMQGGSPGELAKTENMFRSTLKSLFALAEAYPELKANSNFQQLQTQFENLEKSIESARRYYNAAVRDYNTQTETFPSVIIAGSFNFKAAEFFELESAEERKPIRPDFS